MPEPLNLAVRFMDCICIACIVHPIEGGPPLQFLADRTNGRAYAWRDLVAWSVSSVCLYEMHCDYQNGPWPLFRGRIKVTSTIALHLTLNISETVRDILIQRTTVKKWHMGYQMVTPWRHVTVKGQPCDHNTLRAQYLENSWRCYSATIAAVTERIKQVILIYDVFRGSIQSAIPVTVWLLVFCLSRRTTGSHNDDCSGTLCMRAPFPHSAIWILHAVNFSHIEHAVVAVFSWMHDAGSSVPWLDLPLSGVGQGWD